jgi:hypothetical protein
VVALNGGLPPLRLTVGVAAGAIRLATFSPASFAPWRRKARRAGRLQMQQFGSERL